MRKKVPVAKFIIGNPICDVKHGKDNNSIYKTVMKSLINYKGEVRV